MLMHYIPKVTGVESIEEETEDNGKEGVVEQTESEKKNKSYEERLAAAGIPFSDWVFLLRERLRMDNVWSIWDVFTHDGVEGFEKESGYEQILTFRLILINQYIYVHPWI